MLPLSTLHLLTVQDVSPNVTQSIWTLGGKQVVAIMTCAVFNGIYNPRTREYNSGSFWRIQTSLCDSTPH